MGSGTNPEMRIWFWYFQLSEKRLRHLHVVVLTGVNEQGIKIRVPMDFVQYRRDFHEIGPRARNAEYSHVRPLASG